MTDSWFVKIVLRRRHAPMVTNGAFSHKKKCYNFQEILNLEGYKNHINGSRVKVILLNLWVFPSVQSGEASMWMVCFQQGLPTPSSFTKN